MPPTWAIALCVAAVAPFLVRRFADWVEAKHRADTVRFLNEHARQRRVPEAKSD